MATTLPNTGAVIPAMAEAPDQAVNNAAFTAIDTKSGGMIESGSNANGSYLKFADGTLICYGVKNVTTPTTGSTVLAAVLLPQSFIDTNYNISMLQDYAHGNLSYAVIAFGISSAGKRVHAFDFAAVSVTGTWDAAATLVCSYTAIGRWK